MNHKIVPGENKMQAKLSAGHLKSRILYFFTHFLNSSHSLCLSTTLPPLQQHLSFNDF